MIQVLQAGPDPSGLGGIATVIAQLRDEFARRPDVAVDILPTFVSGSPAAKASTYLQAYWRLWRRLRTDPPQVLHIHSSSHGSLRRKGALISLARRYGVPCLLHIHSSSFDAWYEASSPGRQAWIRRQLDAADCVIALSDSWRTYLSGLTATEVVTVYNAVAVESFAGCRRPRDGDPATLLFLGRIGDRKGTFQLLEALARMRAASPGLGWRAFLAGDGELRRARARIEELDLADRVEVLGWIGPDRKRELLTEADLLVLPTRREGLPMSVLEAMAAGLVVVTTPVGGIPEAIRHEQNGWIVPVDRVDRLAEALTVLIRDPARRQALADAAWRTAAQRFDLPVVAGQIVDLYRRFAR